MTLVHTSARERQRDGKAEKQARWRNGNTNGNMIHEMKPKAKRVADTRPFALVVNYRLPHTTCQCKVMLNDKKPTLPGRFPWETAQRLVAIVMAGDKESRLNEGKPLTQILESGVFAVKIQSLTRDNNRQLVLHTLEMPANFTPRIFISSQKFHK